MWIDSQLLVIKEKTKDIVFFFKEIKHSFISYIEFIKRWLSYYKALRYAYDFDYTSILLVEKHQISRLRNVIEKTEFYEGYERDVEIMNTAIKLIDIIIDEPFDVEVNLRNGYRFDEGFKIKDSDVYKSIVYINKAWNLYYKIRKQYTRNWWY